MTNDFCSNVNIYFYLTPTSFPQTSAFLSADLLERSLCEQMTFDPGKSFVGVVVGLFDQTQLLPLTLVQTRLHTKHKKTSSIFLILFSGFLLRGHS